MAVTLKRPRYESSGAVLDLTPSSFDAVVKQGDAGVTWIVLCYVRWSDRCLNLLPVLDTLAQR